MVVGIVTLFIFVILTFSYVTDYSSSGHIILILDIVCIYIYIYIDIYHRSIKVKYNIRYLFCRGCSCIEKVPIIVWYPFECFSSYYGRVVLITFFLVFVFRFIMSNQYNHFSLYERNLSNLLINSNYD